MATKTRKKVYYTYKHIGNKDQKIAKYSTKVQANEALLNLFNAIYYTDFPTIQMASKYGCLDIFKDGTICFINHYKGGMYYIMESKED